MRQLRIGALAAGWIVVFCCFFTWTQDDTSALTPQATASAAQKQLPFGDLLASYDSTKTFGAHQFTPFGDSKFTFTISIPSGWESHLSEVDPDQIAHDTEAPVPIAEFYPSGADDVGINVQYIKVAAEKTLATVVDEYVKANSGTVVTRQQLDSKGRSMEDALMKSNNDDLGPLLTRVTVLRRGTIVFIYTGWCVEENYEKYKRLFGAALESFTSASK
jgi:hypothetical protein